MNMRILTVIQHFTPALAGAEKFGQALAEAFVAAGHTSIVATARWENSWKRQEIINGLLVYRHPVWWIGGKDRRFGGITYMIFLFFFLLRHSSEYDVMLVHQAQKGAFVSALAGAILRKPVVVIVHCAGRFGDLQVMRSSEFGFYTKYMIDTIKKSDAFVAICSDIQVELESEGFQRIRMIHDGIVPWKMGRPREYASTTRLVTLARLHPQKGMDILIRSLALIGTKQEWTLEICGEGPERNMLEALARDLGISERVTFRGLVRNVEEALERSDIFVLPSRGEGMGIALLEAMYAGLPSIVTRVSGFVDIVEHNVNGYLVEPESPQALASAIELMMNDEAMRRRLGAAGRSTILERFTLESTAHKYLALLQFTCRQARTSTDGDRVMVESELQQNIRAHDEVADSYENIHGEIFNPIEQTRLKEQLAMAAGWISNGATVRWALDYGCGSGNVTRHLLDLSFNVIAADVSTKFLNMVASQSPSTGKLQTLLLNGRDLSNVPDERCDLVATYSVLHHIPDYLSLVRELARVTRSGGIIYIDHELSEGFWKKDPTYERFVSEVQPVPKKHWNRFFILSNYVTMMRRRFNPRYQPEGDIHVWPDDHIEWKMVADTLGHANCEIVMERDYLLFKRGYAIDVFKEFQGKCNDTHLLVARKR